MNNTQSPKLFSVLKAIVLTLVATLLGGCFCKEVPVKTKLVDCTNSTLRFQMTVEQFPPYHFVLGTSFETTQTLNFRGEFFLSQTTGTVARVLISSQDITPCNWLPGLSGYILTWSRTNQNEQLKTFLNHGQTYDVEVRFSEQPSTNCSIWFSSMGKACL